MIQKGEWNKKSKKLACVKGPDSKGNESQSKEWENFKKAYEKSYDMTWKMHKWTPH